MWLIDRLIKALAGIFGRRRSEMWLIDDLIKALAQRNEIVLNGAISVRLVEGGIKFGGELSSEIQDRKDKNKTVATMVIPVSAKVVVGDLVIPVRVPR